MKSVALASAIFLTASPAFADVWQLIENVPSGSLYVGNITKNYNGTDGFRANVLYSFNQKQSANGHYYDKEIFNISVRSCSNIDNSYFINGGELLLDGRSTDDIVRSREVATSNSVPHSLIRAVCSYAKSLPDD